MIPNNFEAIFSIFRFFLMASKMAIFRGFGPRHAAGSAERPFFILDIIIYHPKEHSLWISALNSKIFLMATPFCVVPPRQISTGWDPRISSDVCKILANERRNIKRGQITVKVLGPFWHPRHHSPIRWISDGNPPDGFIISRSRFLRKIYYIDKIFIKLNIRQNK